MASIKQRPDGRYRARYRDESGREHARHFTRKTDAKRWLDEVTASVVTGMYVAPKAGRITFKEFAEQWRSAQVFRPSTADVVERALTKRIYPIIGDRPLDSIQPMDIQMLVKRLEKTLAPASVTVTYSYVSTVFKEAVRHRRIARTPCDQIRLPKVEKKRVTPLSTEQVFAIADAIPAKLRAVVITAAGTGMRQGEVFGLSKDRVKFLERKIIVDRQLVGVGGLAPRFGPPKTATSDRIIPLPDIVATELARHMEQFDQGPDGLLFTGGRGAVLRRSTFGDTWRNATEAAGCKGVVFHELRHFYASLLIRHGESVKTVQARLGHKNAEETLNTYAHLWPDSDDRTREAVDSALVREPKADRVADSLRTSS